MYTSLEICAGAGGQALGLEWAGFRHVAAVENDHYACDTLRANRDNEDIPPQERWNVLEKDVHDIDGRQFEGIDLLAGGVPCPPFSVAGRQLGGEDDRDLFPKAMELVRDTRPKAVLLENVRGLGQPRFQQYRESILHKLEFELGYKVMWQMITSAHFGVAQLRPRFVLIGVRAEYWDYLSWPTPIHGNAVTVGEALYELMGANGWPGVDRWSVKANSIGPTLVGGSKKHGGPDLGPTRARQTWAKLGVRGTSIAEEAPGPDFPIDESPRLTVQMGAVLQGFPENWRFIGGKTAAWRQVGNAFPPPVARALGESIRNALDKKHVDKQAMVSAQDGEDCVLDI
ncbi:DNA cytosine methyltransferase [Corynebacterium sp. CCM 9203]|uniref:DNA cytosine methyltransferase n=1 Tax=Corynebacterium sp. CCM 9203 TaxID=3057615 RepID=UPI0035244FCD